MLSVCVYRNLDQGETVWRPVMTHRPYVEHLWLGEVKKPLPGEGALFRSEGLSCRHRKPLRKPVRLPGPPDPHPQLLAKDWLTVDQRFSRCVSWTAVSDPLGAC